MHNERTFRVSDVARLEDPERLQWLPPDEVLAQLALRREMTVADIGAGTGYFTIPFAKRTAMVFAVDLQREMLELLRPKIPAGARVELIEAESRATTLPDRSCDLAFLSTVWHELDDRAEVLDEMRRILKPGGTVAILDWRPDVERPPGPRIEYRIDMDAVAAELGAHGFDVTGRETVGRFTYLVQATPSPGTV